MRRWALLLAVVVTVTAALPAAATDLTKIDRTIAKEPAYQSAPKYCLLVFGPEAKMRVWLVLDGETLYVDRNANGDLTEPGEKVVARQLGQGDLLSFSAGDISDGKLVHKGLSLDFQDLAKFAENDAEIKELHTKDPKVLGCMLFLNVAIPGWKGPGSDGRITHLIALRDANGFLQFTAKPQRAPIIHFGGQYQLTLYAKQKLTIDRETDLILAMGTPGLGPGTTAFVAYDGVIPEKVYPRVTVTYPPARSGQSRLKELYELKKRC